MILLSLLLAGPALAGDYRTVDDVLAKFDNEPDIQAVQEMVLEYSKTDPHYVDAWLSAAKNSA